ncbi:hypothetical protein AC1031_004248 [Aphanomyces cochlioides]|nr:hypothetical protein AC1031_004248 [Aphanomyces cochlioides]
MAPNLFTPIQVGFVQLKNRIFMAPLTRIRAGTSHMPTDLMKEYYSQRASAGLIIAEGSMMAPNTMLCLANSVNEIASIVELFATASKKCIDVGGFDSVEVHGANGYLIDQFLRTSSNTSTDQYGGSLENRARFLTEVLQAVTDAVGAGKVGVRFSPLNGYNDMQDEDPMALSEHVAKISQRFNLAYVHLIRGDMLHVQEGDLEPIFRKHFHNTFISNMGYTKDEANAAIEAEKLDAVAFGALFIANPDLPERFAKDAPLNDADPTTYYVGGAKGYTDYPTLP